ncbi:hypothetical protein PAMP_016707 [Pampus punctatissimus]
MIGTVEEDCQVWLKAQVILYCSCVEVCPSVLRSSLLIKRFFNSEPRETPENAELAVKHIPPRPFKVSADRPVYCPEMSSGRKMVQHKVLIGDAS